MVEADFVALELEADVEAATAEAVVVVVVASVPDVSLPPELQ